MDCQRARTGYARPDFALQAASRVVDGAFRQSHYGRVIPPTADGERYEPDDWGDFTEQVKAAARFYGAADVGVTLVNEQWLYATGEETPSPVLTEKLTTAMVTTIEMDYDLVMTSPAATASAATGMAYSQMAMVAASLAAYLAALGYSALPSGNDTALSIPLAVEAGLGELGRSGNLLTPDHGPRVRLCKVFTDAPLVADAPIEFGAQKTCESCTLCADACPGDAIARGAIPSDNTGVARWRTDADKCRAFWQANGTNCSNCIAHCPYNRRPRGRALRE